MAERHGSASAAVVAIMFLGIWAYSIIHYGFLGFFLGWIPSGFLALLIGGAVFVIGYIITE